MTQIPLSCEEFSHWYIKRYVNYMLTWNSFSTIPCQKILHIYLYTFKCEIEFLSNPLKKKNGAIWNSKDDVRTVQEIYAMFISHEFQWIKGKWSFLQNALTIVRVWLNSFYPQILPKNCNWRVFIFFNFSAFGRHLSISSASSWQCTDCSHVIPYLPSPQ